MRRRAFLRRMASAAVGVGLLGSELLTRTPQLVAEEPTGLMSYVGGRGSGKQDTFEAYMTEYVQLVTQRLQRENHRQIYGMYLPEDREQ